MTVTIQTSRLRLRTPTVEDLPAYLAYRNDPAALRALGMVTINDDQGLAFMRKQSELDTKASGWRMLGVERIGQAGLIGEVGVFLREGNPMQGDVGWWLHPDHRRNGYASEAALALAGWCFIERGLGRITAACLADNIVSRSVMERIGMRLVRQSKVSRHVDDQWYDEVGYEFSRHEWETQAQSTGFK